MNENAESTSIAIYHFLDEQLELFKDHLLCIKASMDEETIHQMRVAVKKIRTIQKLKKHINFPKIIDKQQYKTIKEIFAVSGQMRDLQIQQNLLGGYIKILGFSFQQLSKYLAQRHEIFEEELHQKIKETSFSDFPVIQQDDNFEGENHRPDFENEGIDFIALKINAINRLVFTLDRIDHVHDLRKALKQLFFILQFFKKHFSKSNIAGYKIKRLRKITDRLGHWNDRDVFNSMLQEFLDRQDENFQLINPGYTILQYALKSEMGDYLRGIEVDVYLELIKLKALIQKAG